MTLPAGEFMRRFPLHVSPDGFHRIRRVDFLANTQRTKHVACARDLLAHREPSSAASALAEPRMVQAAPQPTPCSCCGARMVLFEIIKQSSCLRPSAPHDARRQDRQLAGRKVPRTRAVFVISRKALAAQFRLILTLGVAKMRQNSGPQSAEKHLGAIRQPAGLAP